MSFWTKLRDTTIGVVTAPVTAPVKAVSAALSGGNLVESAVGYVGNSVPQLQQISIVNKNFESQVNKIPVLGEFSSKTTSLLDSPSWSSLRDFGIESGKLSAAAYTGGALGGATAAGQVGAGLVTKSALDLASKGQFDKALGVISKPFIPDEVNQARDFFKGLPPSTSNAYSPPSLSANDFSVLGNMGGGGSPKKILLFAAILGVSYFLLKRK